MDNPQGWGNAPSKAGGQGAWFPDETFRQGRKDRLSGLIGLFSPTACSKTANAGSHTGASLFAVGSMGG